MDVIHVDALSRAVSAVLSTDIAGSTFAQILDGLPTIETHLDRYRMSVPLAHPLRQHEEFCPGVLDKFEHFRSTFDLDMLNFEPRLTAFQNSAEDSREFQLRLIELTAVAIHHIAVLLFKTDTSLHKDDGVVSWMPDELRGFAYPQPPPVTFFYHTDYMCRERYPEGIADMVGYWAENRILGGVTLFDRGKSGFECKDIYFHSDRHEVTFRIYKLLDTQVGKLWKFLRSYDQPTTIESPLPILGDRNNRDRVDPDGAIDIHGIFRDRWEREIPDRHAFGYREPCVVHVLDYPELDDLETMNAAWEVAIKRGYK